MPATGFEPVTLRAEFGALLYRLSYAGVLVRFVGFEPTTYGLKVHCSAN